MNHLNLIILILPLIASVIAPLFYKKPNVREAIILITSSIAIALSVYVIYLYEVKSFSPKGEFIIANLLYNQINFSIDLSFNLFTAMFVSMVSILWFTATIYSIGYMRGHNEKNQTRFFSFFAVAIFSTFGIAFSSNLWTTFLFYEMLTLCTFPLVGHNINNKNKKQAFTYLNVLVAMSMLLFLPAIILTSNIASTTYQVGGVFNNVNVNPYIIILLLLMFLFGIAKSAIVPFHQWLPSAMIAPTPVSALLHAVAVVKSGIFVFLKVIIYIFGVEYLSNLIKELFVFNWILIFPSITIIWASFKAIYQDNLKKRLAYSTISQLSYMLLGALLLSSYGMFGSIAHIFTHAFAKITLFFVAGYFIVITHKTRVSQLNGIAKKTPIAMIAFTIASFAMVGIHIYDLAESKSLLIESAISANSYLALITLFSSSILNGIYFFPVIFRGFFAPLSIEDEEKNYGTSYFMNGALIISSMLLLFGLSYYIELTHLFIQSIF